MAPNVQSVSLVYRRRDGSDVTHRYEKGVTLIKADDFETWILGLEVLGDTVYKVRFF